MSKECFRKATILNRKPTTLATWDSELYWNLWKCASKRASLASSEGNGDLAGREYESSNALYSLYEKTKKPAYSPSYPEPIVCDTEKYDRLRLCVNRHVELALGDSESLVIPTYLESAIYDEDRGWQDKVCNWLKVNDDDDSDYTYHKLAITGKNNLSNNFEVVYFVKDNNKDRYWQGCYVVHDGGVYDLSDSNIAECGITDCTIGWFVSTLDDEGLPSECRTDQYSQGYSGNPTSTLAVDLIGEPVYHWGYKCFVGRLNTYPHPVKLYPEVSFYGA